LCGAKTYCNTETETIMWSDFWSVIWFFFWTFAFIAYLFALFSIVADIFRDKELGGWAKAIWIIFLVFVPFLTALVYVIARGKGMADRSSRDYNRAQEQTDDYIRTVAGTTASPSDEISRAHGLLTSGAISQEEFNVLKARALKAS
jgi:hypothetical protein